VFPDQEEGPAGTGRACKGLRSVGALTGYLPRHPRLSRELGRLEARAQGAARGTGDVATRIGQPSSPGTKAALPAASRKSGVSPRRTFGPGANAAFGPRAPEATPP